MARYTKDSVEQFFDNNIFIPSRTIYLSNEEGECINFDTSRDAVKALHLLQFINTETITVIINSFGGCWYNGMAIYDSIKQAGVHVDAYVIGSAMSMGSVILQAADKRYIYPNATLMIHDGDENLHGTARSVLNWSKTIEQSLNDMYKIYAERSGKTVAFWRKKCANDFIMTAQEALELGLVDEIVGESDGKV